MLTKFETIVYLEANLRDKFSLSNCETSIMKYSRRIFLPETQSETSQEKNKKFFLPLKKKLFDTFC